MARKRSHTRRSPRSNPRGVLTVHGGGFGFVQTAEGAYFIPASKMAGAFDGDLVEDGLLTFPAANLLIAVMFASLLITMALFFLVYVFLIFAWARVMGRFIKEGPVAKPAEADNAASDDAKRKDVVPGFAPVDDPAVAAKGGE